MSLASGLDRFDVRNFFGAFADAAILFPLLAVFSSVEGVSPWIPLLSSGIAYIVAGFFFRIPISVQPLKSIVIAGVASGASAAEIRWSGLLVGVFCLGALALDVERWAARIPRSVIHGVQAGLGLLLIGQGWKALGGASSFGPVALLVLCVVILVLLSERRPEWPLLGAIGVAALTAGFADRAPSSVLSFAPSRIRWDFVLSLVLPQIALTMANSVLATRDVCHRYFGNQAVRVTHGRLLSFIGIGNILAAAFGGLPFCHGSGGVTAHYRGGARHWNSVLPIGLFLILLSATVFTIGAGFPRMPPFLLAILLTATGVFHCTLARPTWEAPLGKMQLLVMGITAITTKNMLWVLVAGIGFEMVARLFPGEGGGKWFHMPKR